MRVSTDEMKTKLNMSSVVEWVVSCGGEDDAMRKMSCTYSAFIGCLESPKHMLYTQGCAAAEVPRYRNSDP